MGSLYKHKVGNLLEEGTGGMVDVGTIMECWSHLVSKHVTILIVILGLLVVSAIE